MGFQTDCVSTGENREAFYGSVSPPIYESSLFTFPSSEAFERAGQTLMDEEPRPIYTRGNNPTVRVLERKVALLEGAEDARAFASGMAAISAALMSAAGSGHHIVAVRSIYSNAYRLLHDYLPRFGLDTTFADFTDLDAVRRAIRPNTRVLYLESPGNPAMHLIDLEAVAFLARERNLVTVIDNTMATPFNQRPLQHGIDLVVHSASKYLAGHSDVVAGIVAGNTARIAAITDREQRDLGGVIGPFEAWLILRGMRTLGLRMKHHNAAGLSVAEWLEARPEVERVNYSGLHSHPQYNLARRQMSGHGGVLSFEIAGGRHRAVRFVNGLRHFGIGVSWGGFESLALPMNPPDHMPPELQREVGLVPGLVRLSIGLEDTDDLLADLDQALFGAFHD